MIVGLLTGMAYMTWFERRVIGRLQIRIGPNRVGPTGLLQPVADALKLFFKEDIRPAMADRWLYPLAPAISLVAALAAFAVIPIGPNLVIAGKPVNLIIQDMPVAVLYLIGVSSLGVYGVVLGGWSSGSKYSLLGALRGGAQVVSYELVLGLALVGVVLVSGTLSLGDIVLQQKDSVPYVLLQPLGFLLYFTAAIAETNRAPFDLPEAEQELVAGLSHRVQRLSLRAVLHCRIRQRPDRVGDRRHAFLQRLGRTLWPAERPVVAVDQDDDLRVRLRLDPRHAAATALRPVDAVVLGAAAAAGPVERDRHRDPGGRALWRSLSVDRSSTAERRVDRSSKAQRGADVLWRAGAGQRLLDHAPPRGPTTYHVFVPRS